MYKRRNEESLEDYFLRLFSGGVVLIILYPFFLYYTNKNKFWYDVYHYILPLVGVGILILGVYFFILFKKERNKEKHFEAVIKQIDESGFKSSIDNFITMFGKEKSVDAWEYRNYRFDLRQLDDFSDSVAHSNLEISTEELKNILKYFIDEKEKRYLNERIETKVSHDFNELNNKGDDFENLIVRLYSAMGYVSKRIGGTGDQGADVIASRNGENILIQAKCYHGSVGNAAVQQAVAALEYYKCVKAVVITTSYFTAEAIALAKSNSVELVDGELLKRKLLEFLKEVWV